MRSPAPVAPRSELRLRVVSGLVMAAVALGATLLGGPLFSVLWLAAAIAVAFEWVAMTRAEPGGALVAIVAGGLVILVIAYRYDAAPALLAAIGLATLAALLAVARGSVARAWTAGAFACAAVIALIPTVMRDRPDLGAVAILWTFAVVWTTDVAAYFTGRRLGGPKLWPAVSPKKTWSGFVGGLVGATAAGTLVVWLGVRSGSELPVGLVLAAAFSALASVASQLGDLAESAMKRRFGAKDSSDLIPGHGGFMDRLDGFAAVACLAGLALAGSRLAAR